MKLSKKALNGINKVQVRLKLALALGVSEQWIIRLIKENPSDSVLTKAIAVQITEHETGLRRDQILVKEPELENKLK